MTTSCPWTGQISIPHSITSYNRQWIINSGVYFLKLFDKICLIMPQNILRIWTLKNYLNAYFKPPLSQTMLCLLIYLRSMGLLGVTSLLTNGTENGRPNTANTMIIFARIFQYSLSTELLSQAILLSQQMVIPLDHSATWHSQLIVVGTEMCCKDNQKSIAQISALLIPLLFMPLVMMF